MDQFDRLLFQESHNFSGKTPLSLSSSGAAAPPAAAGAGAPAGTFFHPMAVPQHRTPLDALSGVLNCNASIRRQLKHDIVRVVLASSGIPPHLVTDEDMLRILEAVASELLRVPTPVEDRATISNELVWSALRDAPPGIETVHRPGNQMHLVLGSGGDGTVGSSSHHNVRRLVDPLPIRVGAHSSQSTVAQPLPLKQKARSPTATAAAKPPHSMIASNGSNVTRSVSSAFSECSSGSFDVCSSVSHETVTKK